MEKQQRARMKRVSVSIRVVAIALVVACGGGAGDSVRQNDSATGPRITDEARAFMDAYARDLLAGDRAAIGARYDRSGAYLLGNGRKELAPYDSVVAQYRGDRWTPPAGFEWRDLSFGRWGRTQLLLDWRRGRTCPHGHCRRCRTPRSCGDRTDRCAVDSRTSRSIRAACRQRMPRPPTRRVASPIRPPRAGAERRRTRRAHRPNGAGPGGRTDRTAQGTDVTGARPERRYGERRRFVVRGSCAVRQFRAVRVLRPLLYVA